MGNLLPGRSGKAHNIVYKMNRMKINILGTSETRLPNTGKRIVNNKPKFYSGCGTNDDHHRHGVATILNGDKLCTNF